MTRLSLPRKLFDRVTAHFLAAYPNEGCGILAGSGDRASVFYPMENIEPSPVSYFMDPAGQFRVMKEMRAAGLGMVAICHSHPASPAYPSPKDVSLAFYEDAACLIVGLLDRARPDSRAFLIKDGQVREIVLDVLDED